MSSYHIPVMPVEVIELLSIKKDSWYIDCNLGGGGHTEEILKKGGKVLGIDLDPESIEEVAKNHSLKVDGESGSLFATSDNLVIVNGNFTKIDQIVEKFKISKVMGVLFDLGVSTHQLEVPERGFSFNKDAELDMRMDKSASVKAADLVNALGEKELADLLWKLGEENFSRRIAKKIVEYRKHKLIQSTNELASIILSSRPRLRGDRTHPATRTFQALRIAVNDELNSLKDALPNALKVLSPGGRLVVISFHSLEDRIVKNYFRDMEKSKEVKILTKRPFSPTFDESEENPRSRSGKLRAVEKI